MMDESTAKEIVDYALIVIPIALSFVAIWVSLLTAHKQNKIALFDLRYKCIFQIRTILAFENAIDGCKDATELLYFFDVFWGVRVSNMTPEEQLVHTKAVLRKIHFDVWQANYLFRRKYKLSLYGLTSCLENIILDATGKKVDQLEIAELHDRAEAFYKKDWPALRRKTRL